jgi:hypothetical protein
MHLGPDKLTISKLDNMKLREIMGITRSNLRKTKPSADAMPASPPGPAVTLAAPLPSKALLLPSLSPLAKSFSLQGQSKEQRWRDASLPPTVSNSTSPPSYREALLGRADEQPQGPCVAAATPHVPPKVVLKTSPRWVPQPLEPGQGWQRVESRRAHKSHLR